MKKIILGIIIGIALLIAGLYFGGGKHVKTVGKKAIEAGEKMEEYEKDIKKKADRLQKAVKKTAKDTKEVVKKTADGAKNTADKLKKVKEAVE